MISPQDLVDKALSVSAGGFLSGPRRRRGHRCQLEVGQQHSDDQRGGHSRRDVTVISVVSGGDRRGRPRGESPQKASKTWFEPPSTPLRTTANPAEDQSPLAGAAASSGDWDAPPAETSIATFGDLAPQLGEAFRRAGAAKDLLFGYAHHEIALEPSLGFDEWPAVTLRSQPTGHLEINAKSIDFARSAWAGVPTRDFADMDVDALTGDLSRRLGWADRSIDLPPGRYQTVLPPCAVADLMIYLYWSAGARDAADGRTVFSGPGGGTRVGERLTDAALSLRSDPSAPRIGCTPFVTARHSSGSLSVFDNGIGLEPTSWISNGVLSSLVQTRHSARLTGLPSTPYVDNLILEGTGSSGDVDHLVGGVERGLLLTCLW